MSKAKGEEKGISFEVVTKPKERLKVRAIPKDLFLNSPKTVEAINYGIENFGKVGAYYGIQTIANCSFMLSPTLMVFAKFGESGIGKTLPERVALKVLYDKVKLLDLSGSKGITPAGLSKLYRRSISDEANEKDINNWQMLANSNMVYLEDMAMLRTQYVRETTAIVLHRLPYNTDLSDLTSSGEATLTISLGAKKRVMFSGTPDVYDEITSLLSFDEFMNRRCIYLTLWLTPKEWQEREKIALRKFYTDSDRETKIVSKWIKMLKEGLKSINPKKVKLSEDEDELKKIHKERKFIYKEMIKFKRIPESALEKIDGLAFGHAIFEARTEVLAEDYQFISLLLWRFISTAIMRHDELAIFNEICRRNGKGVYVREVADYLRVKAKSEHIPELIQSTKRIKANVELSHFMDLVYEEETKLAKVMFSDEAKKLTKLYNKVLTRVKSLAKNNNK